jgi:hypothetical protein
MDFKKKKKKEIHTVLPRRNMGTLQVRYSTNDVNKTLVRLSLKSSHQFQFDSITFYNGSWVCLSCLFWLIWNTRQRLIAKPLLHLVALAILLSSKPCNSIDFWRYRHRVIGSWHAYLTACVPEKLLYVFEILSKRDNFDIYSWTSSPFNFCFNTIWTRQIGSRAARNRTLLARFQAGPHNRNAA